MTSLQAESGEFRRAMFLLCTLALMGTEDQLFQAKGNGEVWARLSWSGRLELRVRTRPTWSGGACGRVSEMLACQQEANQRVGCCGICAQKRVCV